MQATTRQKQGTLDYFETDWLPRESEAAQAFVELAAIQLASSSLGQGHAKRGGHAAMGSLKAGYCRMNMSQSRHMARKVSINHDPNACQIVCFLEGQLLWLFTQGAALMKNTVGRLWGSPDTWPGRSYTNWIQTRKVFCLHEGAALVYAYARGSLYVQDGGEKRKKISQKTEKTRRKRKREVFCSFFWNFPYKKGENNLWENWENLEKEKKKR
jgi:hypothetical protein